MKVSTLKLKKIYLFLAGIFLLAGLLLITNFGIDIKNSVLSLTAQAQTTCELLSSSSGAPKQGFGASYDVFSSAKDLLIKAVCSTSSATITIGDGDSHYIYEKGYVWKNNQWQAINFSGANKIPGYPWYVQSAHAVINLSPSELSNKNYVVAYVCTWKDNQWKCGCEDTTCANNYWQLQVFQSAGQGDAAPIISNGSPTGALPTGTTQTTLSVSTNENATCKYSQAPNTPYASMPNTFTTTGGMSHSQTLTGLTNGTSYNYYVRCQDTANNPNATDYPIAFSVGSIVSSFEIKDIQTVNLSYLFDIPNRLIEWKTTAPATGQVKYWTGSQNPLTTNLPHELEINHGILLEGLEWGKTYQFQVISIDNNGTQKISGVNGFTIPNQNNVPSLIANPGFERDLDGDGVPHGWKPDNDPVFYNAFETKNGQKWEWNGVYNPWHPSEEWVKRDNTEAHSGNYSLWLEKKYSADHYMKQGPLIARYGAEPTPILQYQAFFWLPAGMPHTISFWAKSNLSASGQNGAKLTFYKYTDSAPVNIQEVDIPITDAISGWKKYSKTFTLSEDAHDMTVLVYMKSMGEFWVDDFELKPEGPLPSLVHNLKVNGDYAGGDFFANRYPAKVGDIYVNASTKRYGNIYYLEDVENQPLPITVQSVNTAAATKNLQINYSIYDMYTSGGESLIANGSKNLSIPAQSLAKVDIDTTLNKLGAYRIQLSFVSDGQSKSLAHSPTVGAIGHLNIALKKKSLFAHFGRGGPLQINRLGMDFARDGSAPSGWGRYATDFRYVQGETRFDKIAADISQMYRYYQNYRGLLGWLGTTRPSNPDNNYAGRPNIHFYEGENETYDIDRQKFIWNHYKALNSQNSIISMSPPWWAPWNNGRNKSEWDNAFDNDKLHQYADIITTHEFNAIPESTPAINSLNASMNERNLAKEIYNLEGTYSTTPKTRNNLKSMRNWVGEPRFWNQANYYLRSNFVYSSRNVTKNAAGYPGIEDLEEYIDGDSTTYEFGAGGYAFHFGDPKPSFIAYNVMVDELGSYWFKEKLNTPSDIWVIRYERESDGKPKWVIWKTSSGSGSYSLNTGSSQARIVNPLGKTTLINGPIANIPLISGQPVFVEGI